MGKVKDIGLRIGSKKQQFLEQLKEAIEKSLMSNQIDIILGKANLDIIEKMIKEEEEAFNKKIKKK